MALIIVDMRVRGGEEYIEAKTRRWQVTPAPPDKRA
tara:strand:+ start:3406 stop:3513 length:108 start_codon:yes stop_codon:yes gene_type:complete